MFDSKYISAVAPKPCSVRQRSHHTCNSRDNRDRALLLIGSQLMAVSGFKSDRSLFLFLLTKKNQ